MKTIGPNISAIERISPDLAQILRQLHDRLNTLETAGGQLGASSDRQGPTMPAPPTARVGVVTGKGIFKISITNPEFQTLTSRKPTNHNPFRTTIHHVVELSPTPDFKTNVTSLPAGPQTYNEISISGTHYVRVRSTYDGQNWTTSAPVGPFSA